MYPKKSLGQHWLNDEASLHAMCQVAKISPGDTVLEIGPGLGPLTKLLVKEAHQVVAVEFDPYLASALPSSINAANLKVVHQDILKFDLNSLPNDYRVAANVPYYITSKIVRLLLESPNRPSHITLLVQKEVAERIAALPGGMSVLSVSAQYYAKTELGPIVPAHCFTPPPEVDSQIISLVPHRERLFPGIDTKSYFRVVKSGFAERRKKLRSSLAGGLHLTKDQVDRLLSSAELSPESRAQELSLEQWASLTRAYLGTIFK